MNTIYIFEALIGKSSKHFKKVFGTFALCFPIKIILIFIIMTINIDIIIYVIVNSGD